MLLLISTVHSFLFLSSIALYEYNTIYSSVYEHFPQLLAIPNKTVVKSEYNLLMDICFHFYWVNDLGVEVLGHCFKIDFTF